MDGLQMKVVSWVRYLSCADEDFSILTANQKLHKKEYHKFLEHCRFYKCST